MKGIIPYIGGKNRLAKQIIALIPEHTTYVEAFGGGGQVLFHKQPSKVEIYNDLDFEVVNFFRVCQQHYEELVRYLRFTVMSRQWFELLIKTAPDSLTDIQRAARFFYIQKNSFGGLIVRQSYHFNVTEPHSYHPNQFPQLIEDTHHRLAEVQLECSPYQKILKRYDRPNTFFYLDPPYWQRKLYKFNFTEEDFIELEKLLRSLKGKFILSLNDTPEVRKLFSRFDQIQVQLSYSAQKKAGKRFPELIIKNY